MSESSIQARAVRGPAARAAARFGRSESGIAALEFALILPILLMAYFGTIEIANVMSNTRKVDLLTRTIGDFFGASTTPTRRQIDDVFRASKVVLLPFDGTGVEMVVSAVGISGGATLRVCSSVSVAGTDPRAIGSVAPIAVPGALQVPGMRMLLVEVRMKYKPLAAETFASLFGQQLDGIAFSRSILWPVRAGHRYASQSPEVVLPGGLPCLVP